MQLTNEHFIGLIKKNCEEIIQSNLPVKIEITDISPEKNCIKLLADKKFHGELFFAVNNQEKQTYSCSQKWKIFSSGHFYTDTIIDYEGNTVSKTVEVQSIFALAKEAEEEGILNTGEGVENCAIRTQLFRDGNRHYIAYEYYPYHQDCEPYPYILLTTNKIIDYPISAPYIYPYYDLKSKNKG